ncbi:DUF6238 family protein [Streptomyces diastatochromogenes]|uniref:Uncharacterized protein n=1 Tax=Streptomyces diastatochromogenes TaxID=42236 RepID=A0A233SCT4_STRDA|nr:DUF6238 family protein [Streptomyces diastatochromogenes]MCZ0990347.1 DUF6238 family protein [Streptomyces diastatochromogenes]OXY93467.1 hypothetical protein BEK98_22430 [Streptomyces diastatochromogenes]
MTQPGTLEPDAQPYLRAATAGVRHHTRTLNRPAAAAPVSRVHLDALHAHLAEVQRLLHQLAETTRPPHPGAGRHLATAHTRLYQATTEIHAAFHLLPATSADSTQCRPEQLPAGPPFLTICQRHLAAGHIVRRTTTPTDLNRAPHTTACVR